MGALLLFAGIGVAGAAFEGARRRETPGEIAVLLSLTRVGVGLVAVGGVVSGAFGLWLVHLGRFGYGSSWVVASIATYVVVLALGGYGGRRPKRARILAARLAAEQRPVSDELRALLNDAASRAANYLSLALTLALVSLMVFKP